RDCTVQPTLVVPGGSEPDWGPADVQPAPRPTPAPGGGGSAPAAGGAPPVTVAPAATVTATLRVTKAKLAKALRSGLKLRRSGAAPGRQAIVAKRGRKVVARGTAKVAASGSAKVTLRFTKSARKALRRARTVRLAISGGGAKAAVTLKR